MKSKYQFPILGNYRITQEYGENALHYDKLGIPGLLKHDGVDIAVPTGTPLLCIFNARISEFENTIPTNSNNGGYGNFIRLLVIDNGEYYDWVFGHLLQGFKAFKGMDVYKGEEFVMSDNTGFSTGPHVHIGVRKLKPGDSGPASKKYLGKTYSIPEYNNGALGYIDPMQFFESVENEVFPVDTLYGQLESKLKEYTWKVVHEAYAKRKARENAIPWSDRLMKAFVYGYWDAPSVFDPAMVETWRNMSKPEYLKRLGRL